MLGFLINRIVLVVVRTLLGISLLVFATMQ